MRTHQLVVLKVGFSADVIDPGPTFRSAYSAFVRIHRPVRDGESEEYYGIGHAVLSGDYSAASPPTRMKR